MQQPTFSLCAVFATMISKLLNSHPTMHYESDTKIHNVKLHAFVLTGKRQVVHKAPNNMIIIGLYVHVCIHGLFIVRPLECRDGGLSLSGHRVHGHITSTYIWPLNQSYGSFLSNREKPWGSHLTLMHTVVATSICSSQDFWNISISIS